MWGGARMQLRSIGRSKQVKKIRRRATRGEQVEGFSQLTNAVVSIERGPWPQSEVSDSARSSSSGMTR